MIKDIQVGLELRKIYKNYIEKKYGSIIVVIATDAPLTSRQLGRLARRACNGISRTGGMSSHTSGEFAIAFSTKNTLSLNDNSLSNIAILDDYYLNPLFRASIEATEEAILNSLFKSTTMKGRDNNIAYGLPVDKVLEILEGHNRIV